MEIRDTGNQEFLTKTGISVISTDLESRPATTPRLIARSSILKPIFGKKLLQLEDFALQQQGFLHVIPMATLTGYNLT